MGHYTMPPNNRRPTVFIGSSSEGLRIAEAIQLNLDDSCDAIIWSQGVFGLSGGTLETLTEAANAFDFAILVATPDDLVLGREQQQQSPRDNVLLEIGLFIGALGRKRTFIVYDRTIPLKLPSDLAGVTHATYQLHDSLRLEPALGACCARIKSAMSRLGSRPTSAVHLPAWILSHPDSWHSFLSILSFAKNVHTYFQAIYTGHLDRLSRTIAAKNPERTQEFQQAWNHYVLTYTATEFRRELLSSEQRTIDSAFNTIANTASEDHVKTCRGFYTSIGMLLPSYSEAHVAALATLGRGSLGDVLNDREQSRIFENHLDSLSQAAVMLITQADAMIVTLIHLIPGK